MTRRLWLVRHAAPLVAPGICYGRLDLAADAQATRQAAQALAEALPARAAVRHSPLRRCVQLAEALQALRPELRSQPDARLQEMDFGAWEGQPWEAVPRAELDAWAGDLHGYAPGGGEPLAAMLARIAGALDASGEGEEADVVWITHAGVARCVHWLRAHPQKTATAAQWTQAAPAPGQWTIARWEDPASR
ncbi:histidine phosphatase family protein [Comamonas endophytica]|uniref:Histidine phosphatase family protein n=1 Tax=Comamonas endophytica TaxID=2949090 RepID=A0ABY6GEH2_9BURK|nr:MULTISPECIES: histidine phosphatase family protein [unclassified Acidovorax]MCD2512891.1 histidine phosphatase family protein [Acidovorax sp. D4N7]UYG52762.1 histidine phosphatase family protein [Acidovorax sp. 5MLIR]